MTHEQAAAWARIDAETIARDAQSIRMDRTEDPDRHDVVLVDGQSYSPSWRALDGGSTVWGNTTDPDVIAAYEDALDRATATLGVWWEDGMLMYELPELLDR